MTPTEVKSVSWEAVDSFALTVRAVEGIAHVLAITSR